VRLGAPRTGEASASLLRALLVLALCASGRATAAEEAGRGPAIYEICGACHGPSAGGIESLAAPPLAGRESWYLLRQLRNFSTGVRGGKADAEAEEMRQILATVPAESDWKDIVDFVRGMPGASRSPSASSGDVARGERLFVTCAACHGAHAEGNEALDAPALAGLPPWYLGRQLQKFRAGTRGSAAQDAPSARMRAAAAVLGSDGDIAAVSAYIGAMTPAAVPTAPKQASGATATHP